MLDLETDAAIELPDQLPSPEAIASYYEAMSRFWQPVLMASELGEQPVLVHLLGRKLALARLDGEAVAFPDVCRHLGAALSRGQILDGSRLQCLYHGWTYDATGRCVDIPGRAVDEIPPGARVRRHLTCERYGLIWVCLADEPRLEIAAFPEYDDDSFYKPPLVRQEPIWRTSATRTVMAALDDSHFPWVHDGSLASTAHPTYPQRRGDAVTLEDDQLTSTYEIEMPKNPEAGGADDGADDGDWRLTRITTLATPNTTRLLMNPKEGGYAMFNAYQPISHNITQIFTQFARQYDKGPEYDAAYLEFNRLVKEEDRRVVEAQRPWLLPPISAQLHLYTRPADLPLIRYQSWMEQLGVPNI